MIYIVLIILLILSILRIIIGPSIWDRLVGLNLMTAKVNILIIFLAYYLKQDFLLDIAITYTLLSFIGTIMIANYLQRKESL
jgi:multicomponent Na+:H+ antiporter subunit F